MPKKSIQIKADYSASGLWSEEGMLEYEDLDPNFPFYLKELIKHWISMYEARLDPDNPYDESVSSNQNYKLIMKNFDELILEALNDKYGDSVSFELVYS